MWGEGSESYSEEVIKTFICKHGSILSQRRNNDQLSLPNLAAIHAGGSTGNRQYMLFGRKVANLIHMGKFRLLY